MHSSPYLLYPFQTKTQPVARYFQNQFQLTTFHSRRTNAPTVHSKPQYYSTCHLTHASYQHPTRYLQDIISCQTYNKIYSLWADVEDIQYIKSVDRYIALAERANRSCLVSIMECWRNCSGVRTIVMAGGSSVCWKLTAAGHDNSTGRTGSSI